VMRLPAAAHNALGVAAKTSEACVVVFNLCGQKVCLMHETSIL
jgi:hypothetical protein